MKTLIPLITALLLATGCSSRITPPVQLENISASTINQGILFHTGSGVPQDIYLESQPWRATLTVRKGRYYLPDEKMIKAFYYAHHAYMIRLTGDKHLIRRYKRYFQRNGVTARFCLKPLKRKDRYRVDMTFSHLKEDLTGFCSTGKTIRKATSPVIKI